MKVKVHWTGVNTRYVTDINSASILKSYKISIYYRK